MWKKPAVRRSLSTRWPGLWVVGLVLGLVVPVVVAPRGAGASTRPTKAAYDATVKRLCKSYAQTFDGMISKVVTGRRSESQIASTLSKDVPKIARELRRIASVTTPNGEAAALHQTFTKAKGVLSQIEHLTPSLKANKAKHVKAELRTIERAVRVVEMRFGAVGLSSCAATTASSGPQPVLDAAVLDAPDFGTAGYGQVRPSAIATSGTGGTNGVVNIVWSSWGGTPATGTGTGCVLQGTGIEANCTRTRADVVAYELGSCSGRSAYLAMMWYFPSLGQSFTPHIAPRTPVGSSCSAPATVPSAVTTTTIRPPTTTTPPVSGAPCSASAITTVLKAVSKTFYALSGYGCTGDFAYAFETVTGTQTNTPMATVTVLLMARSGMWNVVSRQYCTEGLVPAGIHRQACTTQ